MFYAQFHPRGFSNEFEFFAFESKADRDAFVVNVPRSEFCAHYSAMVLVDNGSAYAVAVSAAHVAKETGQDRRQGLRWDGRSVMVPGGCYLDRLTVREWFAGSGNVIAAGDVDERGFFKSLRSEEI